MVGGGCGLGIEMGSVGCCLASFMAVSYTHLTLPTNAEV